MGALAMLANAPIIVRTHGLPGQPGHHHVNNQPQEYWIENSNNATIGYLSTMTDLGLSPDGEIPIAILRKAVLSFFENSRRQLELGARN